MKLSDQDGKLFFNLFVPLLIYVAVEFGEERILRRFDSDIGLNNADFSKLAELLWSNDYLIDAFLEETESNDMPEEHKAIVAGWKKHITGEFIIERHLNTGTVFIKPDTQQVFLVKGITESWEEMLGGRQLPVPLEGTLIPYRDVIISDGLVKLSGSIPDGEFKEACREVYRTARRNKAMLKNF